MHFVNAVEDFPCKYRVHVMVVIGFDFLDFADSGRYGIYYRRQFHTDFAVYLIFKALSRHKSVEKKIW